MLSRFAGISRIPILIGALLCLGGLVSKAEAQKTAPAVTRDSDHDGVPDTRDRCRGTPIGTHVDANGCPAPVTVAPPPAPPAAPPAAPIAAPVAAPTSAPAAAPGGTAANKTLAPGGAPPPAPVTTQSTTPANHPPASAPPSAPTPAPVSAPAGATVPLPVPAGGSRPAPAPAPPPAAARPAVPTAVTDPTMTAGFWMPAYSGHSDADKLEYARALILRLDSAVVALVDVFRNTSGAPLAGATGPNVLSAREKGRWTRCRLIQLDLSTISEAVGLVKDSLPGGPMVQHGAAGLAQAFEGLVATGECDNIGSMIEAPDRWAPWQTNYETSARNFYRDWYSQLRAVHEADRNFARALAPALPAARQFPVPPGLPPNAPTVGSAR